MATQINTFYPVEDTSKINQINFNYSIPHPSKISQLIDPIFNKIKALSSKHLGCSTYLLVSQEDIVEKKILKVASWILGISPTILLGAYVYDHLADFYHRHFENYSRIEEYPDEISENLESLKVQLSKEQPAKIADLLEPSNADDDISNTRSQTDVDSDLGESESKSDFEEKIIATISNLFSETIPQPEIEDCPEEEQQCDTQNLENQGFAESRDLSDSTSNITADSIENRFEPRDITPELNSPVMPSPRSGVAHRIMQIAKGVKAFWANNPFTSNKPNVTNTISSETEHKKLSYEDLKMLDPIIEAYKNPNIRTIAENIAQIKVDLPRMKIFANGIRCENIQDFMNQLGLILNEDETDVSLSDNAIISKIFDLSQQRSLNFAHGVLSKHWKHLNIMPMMAHIEGKRPIVRVNWNAECPEQCEITGEVLFSILSSTDSTFLPYLCEVKIKHSLDKAEVSWEILEEPSSETTANSQATEEAEQSKIEDPIVSMESDDEPFEIPEVHSEDIRDVNYNWDIAFNHLLNKLNDCLNSTVTSEHLKSLKTKHSAFAYEDRLMLPGSITTDEIVNLLNRLKNDNPTNQTIFLPFLVKGWIVDHAVVAVINLADETIEYFDPKGQSYIWPTRAEKQSNKNVFDFLTELGQKIISPTFSKEKIVYNKKNIPQGFSDNINCGAFCLQFIEERITRSFKDIENDIAIDPKELRRQLANRLVKNTHSNSI